MINFVSSLSLLLYLTSLDISSITERLSAALLIIYSQGGRRRTWLIFFRVGKFLYEYMRTIISRSSYIMDLIVRIRHSLTMVPFSIIVLFPKMSGSRDGFEYLSGVF